ncbi:MAG: hypothetical protein AAGB00_07565 [Planctomycetota bacterium]
MMPAFTPCEVRYGHPADFLVEYRILSVAEGGRKRPIGQEYRCNWFYGDTPPESGSSGLYSIWPEFLNQAGELLVDEFAPTTGRATMWIPNPKLRSQHQDKLFVGAHGFMSEGPRPSVECTVVEVLSLHENPIG